METLHLKIIIKSAQIFKAPTLFFPKMCLYAVVAVNTDSSSTSKRTMVDMHGGTQPYWWFPVNFQIDKSKLQGYRTDTNLLICIKCRQSKLRFLKTVVGKVRLPVKSLLEDYRLNSHGNCLKDVAFMLQSQSEKPRGVIYLSYLFGEEVSTSLLRLPPPLPPLRLVPSAPPLPESENSNGCVLQLLPTSPIPSAPYLPTGTNNQ